MVGSLAHPLNIFILGLGGGFLLPLVELLGKRWVFAAFVSALAAMAAISAVCAVQLYHGAEPIKITTGGSIPPYSINLRMGLAEALSATSVGLLGLLGALYFVREKYAVMLLYLLIIMGIQGMVMTRDLFNLFVFLEIVSIATYGLLSLGASSEAQSAAFKFVMATVVASTFFLLGTMFLYAASGMLNIDELIANRDAITGPIGFAALMLLLGCLLLELKPFPANGWGLDVYQTAPGPVAALVASGVSAGVFFALYNLFPLFERYAAVIAALGVSTFVVSNLIGLKQTDAQRLLGYSSVGQMGLLSAALALLHLADGEAAIPLVVGGLFINHFLAKAGLFWLAGYVGKKDLGQWSAVAGRHDALIAFGVLVCALAGMPPFPGFWAKWQLMLALAAHDTWVWIAPILLGSLLEVAFLFRWFGRSLHAGGEPGKSQGDGIALLPVFAVALLLVACGFGAARLSGFTESWLALPLIAGLAFYVLDGLPGRLKGVLTLAVLAAVGHELIGDLSGIGFLFAWLLYAGCLALAIACLYRADPRPGFHPLLALMLLSLIALPRASTSLEFFYLFELVTLSSYFLIARRREAVPDAFRYLLFSIAAGYILVAGFAMANAVTGSAALAALLAAGRDGGSLFVLLAIGFLIKAGAIGVHVWLPGAYAEADDDLSALLSAVVSKMAIFGLLVGAYAAIRSEADLSLAHVVGWIGMLTALVGAMLALQQDNVKRMLAYSSMSQLGYIVTAIALMKSSRLGHRALSHRQSPHDEGDPIPRCSCDHPPHGRQDIRRSRRACAVDASHLRRRDNCHCRHVRAASACWVRRQVAPAERDDGERMVWADRIWCARDLRRLSLHGALSPNNLPRYSEIHASGSLRGTTRAPRFSVPSDPRHTCDVVFPKAVDRSDLRGDRSLFRLDAGLGRHVAGNDLRLLEPGADHGRRCRRMRPVTRRLVAATARTLEE